jgi:DNA-binding PadR family transcriptional regulator
MHGKPGRHVPAFVLLELYKGDAYGLQILNALENNLPHQVFDSAAIYRALSTLEQTGAVISRWDNDTTGASKKVYTLTEIGKEALRDCHNDMKMRLENMMVFMHTIESMGGII